MTMMKPGLLALAGAALFLCAAVPCSAAPIEPSAATAIAAATMRQDESLTQAGYRGGGHHSGRHYGRRHYGWYGHRHRHRHGGVRFFFSAPVVIGGYRDYDDYGYDDGPREGGRSCYRICRDYHGPDYCRYNWRRYC